MACIVYLGDFVWEMLQTLTLSAVFMIFVGSFSQRRMLLGKATVPLMMDSPSSHSTEPDFSPSHVPENGSEESELPVSLLDWSDGEKELDSGGSSPGCLSQASCLGLPSQRQAVIPARQNAEDRRTEVQLFWLCRHKSQQCSKQVLGAQEAEKPAAGTVGAGPSQEEALQMQDGSRTKEPLEDSQEALEKLNTQPSCADDTVQLIDEHGIYSSAKLVPAAETVFLPPHSQQYLERSEGEGFEIREVIVDEKPFQCVICAKAFKRAWELFSHEVVHNEERPFCCQLCQVRGRKEAGRKWLFALIIFHMP